MPFEGPVLLEKSSFYKLYKFNDTKLIQYTEHPPICGKNPQILRLYFENKSFSKVKVCCNQDSNLGCHGHNVKY